MQERTEHDRGASAGPPRAPAGWIALCHAGSLARRGDVRPLDPWGVALLAVRDAHDRIRVFRNVCSHRGRRLVARDTHLPGMTIRCPAHQWLYGLDGTLKSAPRYGPARKGRAEEVDWGKYGLEPVPATVWLDLVFVNLGSGGAPLVAGAEALDPGALTASPLGSFVRTLRVGLPEVIAAYRERRYLPPGALDELPETGVANLLLGRSAGLFWSAVIEPRPRSGCVLHGRYYDVAGTGSGAFLRDRARALVCALTRLEDGRAGERTNADAGTR